MINAPYKQGVFADSNLMPGGMPIICVQSSHWSCCIQNCALILERKNTPFEIFDTYVQFLSKSNSIVI